MKFGFLFGCNSIILKCSDIIVPFLLENYMVTYFVSKSLCRMSRNVNDLDFISKSRLTNL